MAIDFQHHDTYSWNQQFLPCGCCGEPDCDRAELTLRRRDTEVCIGGFFPFQRTEAPGEEEGDPPIVTNPDAFNFDTPGGVLIPVYRMRTVSGQLVDNGTAQFVAKDYQDDVVDETQTDSFARQVDQTVSVETKYQTERHLWPASNIPLGDCAPSTTVVADGEPVLTVELDELGTGIDPVEGYTPVLLSWTDVRPTDPLVETDPPLIGSYELLVDGNAPIGVGVSDTEFQLFLLDDDTTCHEVTVRFILNSTSKGKWLEPVVFHLGENACCTDYDHEDGCGDFSTGNQQRSDPTPDPAEVFTRTNDAGTDTADACDSEMTVPDHTGGLLDYGSGVFMFGPGTGDTYEVTRTVTPAADTEVVVETLHFPQITTGMTELEATDISINGVTFDGFGNITGGTIVQGDVVTGNIGGPGIVSGGLIKGGTLTGGTLTGGTWDGTNVVGATLSGGILTGGRLEGSEQQDDELPEEDGWKVTSGKVAQTRTSTTKTEYSDDRNGGSATANGLLTQAFTKIGTYAASYRWGSVISGAWPSNGPINSNPGNAAVVATYWPVTDHHTQLSVIFGRVREIEVSWQVPADHDANNYRVRWNIAFFSAAWLVWRGAYYTWAQEKYDHLNRGPAPDPDDYDEYADYLIALEEWEALADPGTAPEEPESVPEIVDSQEWIWSSSQAPVETWEDVDPVDPCDPTYATRRPPPMPVDPGEEATPEETAAYLAALAEWEEARDEAIAASAFTSPRFVFSPLPAPPVDPGEGASPEDLADYEAGSEAWQEALDALLALGIGTYRVCNVRHCCDIHNPGGPLDNYDLTQLTTELPPLDPTESNPLEWGDWYQ